MGDILSRIPSNFLDASSPSSLQINIRETGLSVPFNYQTDDVEVLSNILVHDTSRNQLITEDIRYVVDQQKSVLVITERKAHIRVLRLYLQDRFETITISGDDSKRSQKSKMGQIHGGRFQVVIATGQFFGEGVDIDQFDALFLVYPFSFEGKLVQYIGRITRSNQLPIICL